jgi:glycosyltransferase involved in cell wall biosynthesis
LLRTERGKAVTLVNLNTVKGGPVFFDLARARADLRFLGVVGAWGDQVIPDVLPANVTLMDSVSDMRQVFALTRVLLMPSTQDTFGRVGLEAACSGIPTIATPIDGLREALGDAAAYVDRADLRGWLDELDRLDDATYYDQRSSAALAHVSEVNTEREISTLEHQVLGIVTRARARHQ